MIFRRGLIVVLVLMAAWLQVRIWVGKGSLAEVSTLEARGHKEQASNEMRSQRNKVLRAEVIDLKNGVAAIEYNPPAVRFIFSLYDLSQGTLSGSARSP